MLLRHVLYKEAPRIGKSVHQLSRRHGKRMISMTVKHDTFSQFLNSLLQSVDLVKCVDKLVPTHFFSKYFSTVYLSQKVM